MGKRVLAARQAEALEREALDSALRLVHVDATSEGKLDVGPKLNSVLRGEDADSCGGVYRIRATKAPHFVMTFLPTSESNSNLRPT